MKTTELKNKIREHLATASEATAKQITKAIGMLDYPTTVINALSEMRTDAEVECEKIKGKGNELWYWLVKAGTSEAAQIDDLNKKLLAASLRISGLELAVDVAQQTIHGIEAELEAKALALSDIESESARLHAENTALKTLNETMPGFGAMHLAISAGPFVTRTKKRPPRFATKYENAQAAAISAARQHGSSEVFAPIPVGKAVRKQVKAVEFKEATAA